MLYGILQTDLVQGDDEYDFGDAPSDQSDVSDNNSSINLTSEISGTFHFHSSMHLLDLLGKQPAVAAPKPTGTILQAKAPQVIEKPATQTASQLKPTVAVPRPKDETDEELSDLNSEADDSDGTDDDDDDCAILLTQQSL